MLKHRVFLSVLAVLCTTAGALAQIVVPGADGSDGGFNPTSNVTIDLSQAASGAWDMPSPAAGNGVYDADKWAIVFKYSSINIPANVTVTFTNHPSRAPVVWLVSGPVTIAGAVNLDGAQGQNAGESLRYAEPGPGGFRGARAYLGMTSPASAGFGPGGGPNGSATNGDESGVWAGSYASVGGGSPNTNAPAPAPVYGNSRIVPLIGGSGASHSWYNYFCGGGQRFGGGAGGGAMLIASTTNVNVSGSIHANGGWGGHTWCDNADGLGGSGGGVRIVAPSVTGTGSLRAVGGGNGGGGGRIRIETNDLQLADILPAPSLGIAPATAQLWPAANSPTTKILSVGGIPVPAEPRARITFPSADINTTQAPTTTVLIETRNFPVSGAVTLRVVAKSGNDFTAPATLQSGNATLATWAVEVALPDDFSVLQVKAEVAP